MKTKPIFLLGLAGALTLAVMLPAGADAGKASDGGVPPSELSGNPNCGTVGSAAANEFKYEPVTAAAGQNFSLATGVTLTVDISRDKRLMGFTINGALMHDVIVKAGANSNLYHYHPAVTGDTGLHGPIQQIRGQNEVYYEISHVSFCWDFKVNAAPVATDQTEYIDYTEDAVGNPQPALPFALDASDPDGDPLSLDLGTGVTSAGGKVSADNPDDPLEVTYTPPKDFTGSDSFVYTVSDGELTDSATVTVWEVLACGQTVEVDNDVVSGSYTRLGTTECIAKPYVLDIVATSGDIPTIWFVPGGFDPAPADCSILPRDGSCTEQYIGELTFEPLPAANPPATGTLEYDPVPREDPENVPADAFRVMQWCKADPLAGETLTIEDILPGPVDPSDPQGESWCIISATTTTAGDGKTVTTWIIYGIGDPLKRIS